MLHTVYAQVQLYYSKNSRHQIILTHIFLSFNFLGLEFGHSCFKLLNVKCDRHHTLQFKNKTAFMLHPDILTFYATF